MKTIKDFKKRMQVGVFVKSSRYIEQDGIYALQQVYERREVSVVQTASFALKTFISSKEQYENSWCEWPTREEFIPIDDNSVAVQFPGGKLIYEFL